MADSKRRSARVLAEKKRSIYYDPSDDDFDAGDSEGEQDYRPERQPSPGPSQPQRPRKKRKVERRAKPETRAKEKRRQRFKRQPSVRAAGRPKKKYGVNWIPPTPSKKKDDVTKAFTGPSDGRIPDWTRLPAEILRDIFIFASQPMHEQTTTASANVTWLIRAARTCRAFAIPALEAYYQSPSILTSLQPHDLLALVEKPQEKLYMNYKYRIKSLDIDVKRLAYTAHSRRPFQLSDLVPELPRLQHLRVLHPLHTPPYRSIKYQPWFYPPDLDKALADGDVRLKSWRWSRALIPHIIGGRLYPWMTSYHTSKSFEYLERLEVCGFHFNDSPDPPSVENATSQPPGLASAISALPQLKDLTFISCDIVMEDFLEYLPKNLERLELSNCLEVTSDMLYTYLSLGGSQLRELVLNHNAALNLAFLEHLKALCPRLEVLKADLTCYSERMNYNDSVALYDHVLTVDQIPTWPSTLRHLELVHLQKWEAEAAQNLFRSLVDSAKELPELRFLSLQAHINIPWRDRAGFRDQWIERLQRVYLRKKEQPNPHLGSLKQFRLWKQTQHSPPTESNDISFPAKHNLPDEEQPVHHRKMSHVRITPRKAPADAALYSDAPSPSSTNPQQRRAPRRSVRVAESASASTAAEEEESSSDSENDSGCDSDWRKQPEAFIQGLCEVVDVRIDNQRPRENQYTEANFLDSEPSGDEDYRDGAEAEGSEDEGYAW